MRIGTQRTLVISLERSAERRRAMAGRLSATGLDFAFFDAVDGRSIDRSQYPSARRLRDGELGCYLSHVATWRHLAQSTLDSMLVLEDDVEFDPRLLETCTALSRLPMTPHLVRLSSLKVAEGRPLMKLSGDLNLLVPDCHPSGTQGYWVTRSGALRMLDVWSTPRRPIDKQMDRYWSAGVTALLVDPPVVRQIADHTSEIGGRIQGEHRPPGWWRKVERWRRRRVVERIWRRWPST